MAQAAILQSIAEIIRTAARPSSRRRLALASWTPGQPPRRPDWVTLAWIRQA